MKEKIPNKSTQNAMMDVRQGKNLIGAKDTGSMFKQIGIKHMPKMKQNKPAPMLGVYKKKP